MSMDGNTFRKTSNVYLYMYVLSIMNIVIEQTQRYILTNNRNV